MKILHFCWTTFGNKITYRKKWHSRLRVNGQMGIRASAVTMMWWAHQLITGTWLHDERQTHEPAISAFAWYLHIRGPLCGHYTDYWKDQWCRASVFFSCDQAALWMVFSVRLSVCPSVCPSVTPFWLCSHHRIIMKFSGVITLDQGKVHAKGQGQRSKKKLTEVTNQLFVSGL